MCVVVQTVRADALPGVSYPGEVTVEVTDDGVGLDQLSGRRSGTGNLASRARQHGGTFALEPNPSGRGTTVTWTAPIP